MLVTVQQYAQERLVALGEEVQLRVAHLAYYSGWVEVAFTHYRDAEQVAWLSRLEAEHDNLRAALRWSLDNDAQLAALRLGAMLGEFWEVRGHWAEGRRWLEQILAVEHRAEQAGEPGTDVQRLLARVRWQAGTLAWRQCDFSRASALLQQSVTGYREIQDLDGLAEALSNLAALVYERGSFDQARALWEESLTLRRATGDTELIASGLFTVGLAAIQQGDHAAARGALSESLALTREIGYQLGVTYPLNGLGNIANLAGDAPAAVAAYTECLALRRALGYRRGVAATLADLATVRLKQGEYAAALHHYRESLTIFQELGNGRGVACALSGLGRLAQIQGQLLVAARLHGAAATELERIGASLDEPERSDRERALADLRASLTPDQLEAAWAKGALTPGELEVFVAELGASNKPSV